ncbi:hypothetical protein N7G274_001892 [Stereocaulon virgatum]|uniref:Uncharacterized protein n=1 Tax=Stereocaulon virgatum TaxID=373712 RepID=A0ABR4AL02_9LECA
MDRHSDKEFLYYGLLRETPPKHSVAEMPNRLMKNNHPTRFERPRTNVSGSHSKYQSRHESKDPDKQESKHTESKSPGKQTEKRPKTTAQDKTKPLTKEKSKHRSKATKTVRFNLTRTQSYLAESREYFPTTRIHRKRNSSYTYDYDRPKFGSNAYNRTDLRSIVPPKPRWTKEKDPAIAASQARARAQDLRNEVLTNKTVIEDLRGEAWPNGDGYRRDLAKVERYSSGLGGSGRPRGQGVPTYHAEARPMPRTNHGDRSRFFGLGWLRG